MNTKIKTHLHNIFQHKIKAITGEELDPAELDMLIEANGTRYAPDSALIEVIDDPDVWSVRVEGDRHFEFVEATADALTIWIEDRRGIPHKVTVIFKVAYMERLNRGWFIPVSGSKRWKTETPPEGDAL